VAVDAAGNLYVGDAANARVLEYDTPLVRDVTADRVFGQGGSFTTHNCNLGGVSATSLCFPEGVAVDATGNLYVADTNNSRVLEYDMPRVRDVTADRVFGQGGSFTTASVDGCSPNGVSATSLCFPESIAVDTAGNLYVAATEDARVLEYDTPLVRDVTADRVWGQGGRFTTDTCNLGGVSATSLCSPSSIALDAAGNLYVADADDNRVLEYDFPLAVCGNGTKEIGEQCDDGAANGTAGSCCSAACRFLTNETRCDDGTVCNGRETCQAGTCTAGTPLVCDDHNPCTADTCDPTNGCRHTPVTDGTACGGRTVCNGATCQAGTCTPGTPIDCDDHNPCTTDTCDPTNGCQHTLMTDGTACDDATVCNGHETCQAGTCTAGTPLACDDGNLCTTDTCDPTNGCQHAVGNAGVVCRPAAGVCDVAETCTGTSAACPPDAFVPAMTVCRPAAGACDVAETCSGDAADCPADQLLPAGTTCRPAQFACDEAEMCGGTSATCPPDAIKPENALCDDGDPTTDTASCQGRQCVGVRVRVEVQPKVVVSPTQALATVRIPATIQVPEERGPRNADVKLRGFVSCTDLPVSLRPKRCGGSRGGTTTFHAQVTSVFLRITPLFHRSLGHAKPLGLTAKLPLTPLGRKLFAELRAREASPILPVAVRARIRDRRGKTNTPMFPVLLERGP
jgi:sugar lactone lactonase YvrE